MRVALLTVVLLTGCTTTRTLDPAAPALRSEINEQASERSAIVSLRSGEQVRAASLHLAPDLATWLDPETGAGRSARSKDIAEIRFVRRGRGALQGAGVGVALATAAAGVTYATYGDGDWLTNTDAALIVGIGTGVPLAAVGALLGVARGARSVYALPEAEGP